MSLLFSNCCKRCHTAAKTAGFPSPRLTVSGPFHFPIIAQQIRRIIAEQSRQIMEMIRFAGRARAVSRPAHSANTKSAETSNRGIAEMKRTELEDELNHGLHQEASRMSWEKFRQLFENE